MAQLQRNLGLELVEYGDLLRMPYERGAASGRGHDCRTVTFEILRRLGKVESRALIASEAESLDWMLGADWQNIGDESACATQLGDVILLPGRPFGVAVVVMLPGPIVLTATPQDGVRAHRANVLERACGAVVGVYRLRRNAR